jgi:uroporphyrinogen decarboxylase
MRFDPVTELYQIAERSPRKERTMEDLEREVEAQEKSIANYRPTEASYAESIEAMKAFPDRAVPGGGIGVNIHYKEPVWLEAIALRPDIVKRSLAAQAERGARACPVMAKVGLRFIPGGGDFASNAGPFYSPKAFHELTLPALKKVSDACHQYGLFHMFASDGNLWPVADDLFGAAGVDCFYEIDRRAGMDLRRLRERFPHLTLLGGINSYTLHRGTKEEVIEETRSALEIAKEFGSIVVGCSNQIVAGTPPENLFAMIETVNTYR